MAFSFLNDIGLYFAVGGKVIRTTKLEQTHFFFSWPKLLFPS